MPCSVGPPLLVGPVALAGRDSPLVCICRYTTWSCRHGVGHLMGILLVHTRLQGGRQEVVLHLFVGMRLYGAAGVLVCMPGAGLA